MVRMLIGAVLVVLISAAWVTGLGQFYNAKAFVSEETTKIINETLMVTAEHRLELNRSARIADELAMGLMGAMIGVVVGACAGRMSIQARLVKAAITGGVLGAVTGALAGYIGHTFQGHVNLVENTTVHAVLRMIAMFLPFALAMGVTAAMSGDFKRDVSDATVSAVLGILIAAAVYGLASDSNPTTREQDTDILPVHLRNRAIFAASVGLFTLLMISAQMIRKPKANAQP